MSITVDHQPVSAHEWGVATVGDLLGRIQKQQRLVVHVTIDGQHPDLDDLEFVRTQPLDGHVVYVETTEPQRIAGEVFDEASRLLIEAEDLRQKALDALQTNQPAEAYKRLATCFRNWSWTQESVEQVARLLRVDLDRIDLDGITLHAWLNDFAGQLSEIRESIEARDYSRLGDVLAYESDRTTARWQQAIDAIRSVVHSPTP